MRTKSLGGGRRAPSSTATATIRTIPLLATRSQDGYNAAVLETSSESDDDLPDVRTVGSDDNMSEHSNECPHDVLDHESHEDYIDLLDRKICISCNEGRGVLVCSEIGCPVSLHPKCMCSEPKFDDLGNFYCPYCWYKRAVERCRELKKKALIAKKALSNFLDENVVTSDKLVQKDEAANRKVPLARDGISLDGINRQGTDSVRCQPLQTEGDQPRKMHKAASDQYEIALDCQAGADAATANAVDFRVCREEETTVHIKVVMDSMDRKKFDKHIISETRETGFVEDKESTETVDPRYDKEDLNERIVEVGEETEPMRASHLGKGKYTDGLSPDIAFVKGMQQNIAISAENEGIMKDRGKMLQREPEVPAPASSVSETIDSDSEALVVMQGHVKQKVQKKAYSQKVASVSKSLSRNSNTTGKNDCYINEEVTSSKTLRQPHRSPKQVKKRTSMNAKRKRLRWTAEEEKTLKEGVLKFSVEKQNIPWRKILEFGCHVFDNTRTPIDLKDKWKNITAKEGFK